MYNKHRDYLNCSLETYIEEVNNFIQEHYQEFNLKRCATYLSDSKPGRNSYGFNINHSSNDNNIMPSINVDPLLYPNISRLTDEMFDLLDINKNSRVLFNIQKYFSNNEVVVKHFDGHYFEFIHDEKGNLIVVEGLRPNKVSVLTLLNDVYKAGTRVWEPCSEDGVVVECESGDLLVFDNWSCLHGADAFNAESTRKDNLVRMTIGWRSIDDKCRYIFPDFDKEISFESALIIHREKLKSWPSKWEEIKRLNKDAAF